jgi:hypothetical protein
MGKGAAKSQKDPHRRSHRAGTEQDWFETLVMKGRVGAFVPQAAAQLQIVKVES